jgi:NADPH2:quinone reductase
LPERAKWWPGSAAVGLNFFDTLIVAGRYQTKPPFPILARRRVRRRGRARRSGVTEFQPGDRVMGYTNFNAARERTAVRPAKIVKLPGDLDFERAAALTITYGTAYHALKYRAPDARRRDPGRARAPRRASGSRRIELGRIMGARVIACASSDDKLAVRPRTWCARGGELRQRGSARRAQAHGRRPWHRCRIRPVGGRYSEPAVRSLRLGGAASRRGLCRRRHSQTAAQPCAAEGLRDPRRVSGGVGSAATRSSTKAAIATLAQWCAAGKLSCHVQQIYPLAETPTALKALADRKVMGKLGSGVSVWTTARRANQAVGYAHHSSAAIRFTRGDDRVDPVLGLAGLDPLQRARGRRRDAPAAGGQPPCAGR